MRYREILEACWSGYRRVPGTAEYSPGSCKKISEADLEEDLKKWFREKWVRFGPDGKIRGACARGSESEGKPKAWAKKVVRQQQLESADKTPTQNAKEQPSTWPQRKNETK